MSVRGVLHPFDGRTVGTVEIHSVAQIEDALGRAAAAFAQTRALPSYVRHSVLAHIERRLGDEREVLARSIVDESGKTIRDARVEVDRARLVFSLAADEARRQGGEVLPLDLNAASAGRLGLTRRFPLGVVAGITPFNFPLNLVAHKVAPALACGAPIVLKPAEKTPLTALRLAEIVAETSWPADGLIVVTPDDPAPVGALFATDPRVAVLSFTGSDRVGWALKEQAPRKRVTLELGGNAAVFVAGDADIAAAADRCVVGAFSNAGQVCISVQRIYVEQSVFEPFVERLSARAQALRVGDPADPATDIGPMITPEDADRVAALVASAVADGARARLHGERRGRALLTPTVLTGVDSAHPLVRDEAFGPVVVVEPVASFEEGLVRIDDSRFGLQAGIFTRDIGPIFQAFSRLTVGAVIANDIPQWRVDNMPYGGERDSGYGREGLASAIEEMTAPRLLALNLS
jgi:acyl-CoA reductase-like NAD-dependent aldehyde dehydrogenase